MAAETVEITTMIGSMCKCASLRVRESVVAFLLMSLIQKLLVNVSTRRTQSTHKTVTRGPWLLQEGVFGTSGPLLFLRESQGQKTSDHKKRPKIAKPS